MRRHLTLALALASLPAPCLAQAQGPLRIAVTAGLQGDLAPLACVENAPPASALADLARAVRASGAALAVDGGDLMGASALAHLATRDHLDALADAVAASGLRALAVGHRDLAAPHDDLVARARALGRRGVPVVLSNLRCDEEAAALCDAVLDASEAPPLVDTPAGRVAVVAIVTPEALKAVARDRAAGVTLLGPAESLALATLQARAAGADAVVAFYDPDWPGSVEDTLAVVHAVPRAQRPDVLFAHDLAGRLAALQVEREGMRVLSTEPGRVLVTDLRDRASTPAEVPAAARDAAEVPAPVGALVRRLGDALCALARDPLPGAGLARPLSREGMTDLLLDVMREDARAEVAVINRGAVRPLPGFPLQGRVTRLDVLGALPFDDTLRVARMTGEQLRDFVRSPRRGRFRVRGVADDGESLTVNGRPLDLAQGYRVVTTGFVADGGDGGLADEDPPDAAPWGSRGPRDLLLAWLTLPRDGDITLAPVDPARRTRWTFRVFVDASWAETAIANPRNYQDPQLARSGSTAIQVDAEFRADAEHPLYTLDDVLRLRVGFTRTVEGDEDTGLLESADLVTLRNQLAWRGLWRRRRWFLPRPYVESYLESEFTPPQGDMAVRDYRHLQWRPTAGARFELPARANLNLGGGVDWETLDPAGRPAPVLVARGELPPTRLFRIQDRDVEGQLFTELAWREPGGAGTDALVRLTARLSVPLFEPLSITASYDLFARQRGGDPWALAHDLNLGLQLDLVRTFQAFAY